MENRKNNLLFLLMCGALGACANMSSLQTAETLAPGQAEFSGGMGYVNHDAIDGNDAESKASAPYLEFQYRRGLIDKLDMGIKATLIGTSGLDVKYQIIDQEKFDLAVGTGLAYFSISSGTGDSATKSTLWDWTIPVFLSTPVSEAVTLYASPKYMLRAGSGGSMNILGGTLGAKWGKETGIMVETSYGKALGDSNFQTLQYNLAYFFNAGEWF